MNDFLFFFAWAKIAIFSCSYAFHFCWINNVNSKIKFCYHLSREMSFVYTHTHMTVPMLQQMALHKLPTTCMHEFSHLMQQFIFMQTMNATKMRFPQTLISPLSLAENFQWCSKMQSVKKLKRNILSCCVSLSVCVYFFGRKPLKNFVPLNLCYLSFSVIRFSFLSVHIFFRTIQRNCREID